MLIKEKLQEKALDTLQLLRELYDLTYEQLAVALDVTPYYIKCLVNGKRAISENMIDKIEKLEREYARRFTLDCKVDYIHVSFKTLDWQLLVCDVLRMNPSWFTLNHTREFNYGSSYKFDTIKILKAQDNEKFMHMGCLIALRGQGCRLLERFFKEDGRTWFDFFRDCLACGGKFTRIDLAVDDYVEYVPLDEMLQKIERWELQTSFRVVEPKYTLAYDVEKEEMVRQGVTIYFGSRQSQVRLCLYQKNYEMAKRQNRKPEDFDIKNRYEIRFGEEYAQDVVRTLLDTNDVFFVTLGFIFNKVSMLNSQRDGVWSKWQRLMIGVDKIKIVTEPAKTSYERLLRYAKDGFGRALLTLLEADMMNNTHELQNILNTLELTDKYTQILETSRERVSEITGDYIGGQDLVVRNLETEILNAITARKVDKADDGEDEEKWAF